MRHSGAVASTRGLGPRDHVCWAYGDHDEFRTAAAAFLEDGLLAGERVAYVGQASIAELRADLRPLEPLDALLDRGTVQIVSLREQYRPGSDGTPADQADAYAAATSQAVADGYAGLRVAAEATPLVVDPDRRDSFVRYEHLVDRLMAGGLQFSAMCGYDRSSLDATAVDELACVHPAAHGSTTPFHLFATDPAALALSGEVDALSAAAFDRALDRVLPAAGDRRVTVDCEDLTFADHRALLTLEHRARGARVDVVLVGGPRVLRRLEGMLGLSAVRVSSS